MLLAWWLRDPLIPYGGDTPGASSFSADSGLVSEPSKRAAEAVEAMSAAVRVEHERLGRIASSALDAPTASKGAFDHLRKLADSPSRGVILLDSGIPAAWAGQLRQTPRSDGPGTSVEFTDFYVSLQVVADRGGRRAVATSLLHADPPADEIAQTLESLLPERDFVEGFQYRPASDTTAGSVINGATGFPLVRLDALPLSSERMRFATTAAARGKGVSLLAFIIFVMIAVGWFDRRKLMRRIFTLAVAGLAVAMIPWNTFSNLSRAFDPAYFYSPLLGPFTANSGVYLLFASLALLAVIAIVRARRTNIPRAVALGGAFVALTVGIIVARETAQGISLPFWGSTAALWLQWELPIFLLVFALFLTASWLARIALGRRPMIHLRTAALVAIAAGAVSAFSVWNVTTEQRLQLAMRDVAGLQRTDGEASLLLSRFGQQLSAYDTPGTRADLLKRYATSDLAAAEVQVSISAWTPQAVAYEKVDLATLRYDSAELARSVAAADTVAGPVVTQMVGPAGRQLTLVVPHRGGGSTTVIASPRTRLVAQDQYAALLGFAQPDQTEPPYMLTLADVSPRARATADVMTWRRIGNEWHGDQILATSNGPARAHVEVDIRTWGTRLVRASLIVILDAIVAGLLWALGAMAEGGFVRWVRSRASRWALSYRGRLTLALFTFFVVPAVAFGAWSYQRLRGDDRDVRELLVRETLSAATGEDSPTPRSVRTAGNTPIFVFSSGMLTGSTDALFEMIAPSGRMLPVPVYIDIADEGELSASWQQTISNSKIFWGYRAAATPSRQPYVLAAPARSDEEILDRRRRDLTMLVLFATAVGALAALWLSGIAARVLARDLELSKLETARAERVLAWGEMARQVAHEIKNPLTPIRLGVQHLRRARADKRIDFDRVLDENVTRILAEIDHLDEIARAFSRYGSAPSDMPPAEPVDVAAILRDVVGLERMGIGGVTWTLTGADAPAFAQARTDELRDVLLNVFENARLARARNVAVALTRSDKLVTIEVVDDGAGIPSSTLPRVFEPHFSTRTTGSGLGLAITRRLLESWGGTVEIASEEGKGARLLINLHAAES